MSRFWVFSFVFLQVQILTSSPLELSPCKVNNVVTQPVYGTSLGTKNLVQIVQIPPVFIQNVLVGNCENANVEVTEGPGEYFVCKQRYSIVELYVTNEEPFYIQANQTDSNTQILSQGAQIFKTIDFVRDSVVIESGCDFIFNLRNLLGGKKKENKEIGNEKDGLNNNYQFLKSPYHPEHPASLLPPKVVDPSSGTSFQTPYNQNYHHIDQPINQGGNEIHNKQEEHPVDSNQEESYFANYSTAAVGEKRSADPIARNQLHLEQNRHDWKKLQQFVDGRSSHPSSTNHLEPSNQGEYTVSAREKPSTDPIERHKLQLEQNRLDWQKLQQSLDARNWQKLQQTLDSRSSNSPYRSSTNPSEQSELTNHGETTAAARAEKPSAEADHIELQQLQLEQNRLDWQKLQQSVDSRSSKPSYHSATNQQDETIAAARAEKPSADPTELHQLYLEQNRLNWQKLQQSIDSRSSKPPYQSATNHSELTKPGETPYILENQQVGSYPSTQIYPYTPNHDNFTNGGASTAGEPEEGEYPEELFDGRGKETDLYTSSNKIGLPLRILSRKYDPLMNNVDTEETPLISTNGSAYY